MEEQIKKIYEKQKNGRIRMIRNVLLIYAALICVVSIFKGNPFPHQETVLFFDVKQPGWVTTDPWLLWICVVVDLIAGIFILIRDILRDFSKIDRILSQQCDAEKYSEMLEELIKYGKSLDYHGFQKSVMLIAESKYVVALIINGQLQKAEEYIKNEWEGKREGRSWQQVMTNLELSKKYQEKDAAGYSATLEKAGKVFQKNPLFMAKNLMLKGEDEAAVRLLVTANGEQGTDATFTADQIKSAVTSALPEGYAVVDASKIADQTVKYGESADVNVQIGKVATLKVTYKKLFGKTVGTATLTGVQTSAGSKYSFSASEIKKAVPSGYWTIKLWGTKVKYGTTGTLTVNVF